MKKHWIVETHLGPYETWAVSQKKAIANVRYRIFGGRCNVSTIYWKAREV